MAFITYTRLLAASACILLASASCCSADATAEPAKEAVTINLSYDKGPATHRASGFLHAMTTTKPEPAMVDPLKPKCFRMAAEDWHGIGAGAFANYERAKKLGAKMQLVISDSQGYSLYATWWPGDNDDWKPWEQLVESLVKRAQAAGYTFEWDIWNEPNIGYFWQRDQARLFETWKHGYRKIRSLDPEAVIIGPSLSWFDRKYLEAFLLYAKDNDVVPDILSWHELGGLDSIPSNVARMRLFMSRNGIDVKRISINEIIGGDRMLSPGATAKFLAQLERAGVDSACHACWNDKDQGVSNCENQSLNGILTHPDKLPRATWWVYKGYADITGRLVDLKWSGDVYGVAGKDPASKSIRVLLGREKGTTGDVEVVFANMQAADYLIKNGKVRVVAHKIPSSGWEALKAPEKVIDASYSVQNNTLKVVLPSFGPSDAFTLALTR